MPKYADLSHNSTIAMNQVDRGSESATLLRSLSDDAATQEVSSVFCGSWSMSMCRRSLDSKGVELVAMAKLGVVLMSAIRLDALTPS